MHNKIKVSTVSQPVASVFNPFSLFQQQANHCRQRGKQITGTIKHANKQFLLFKPTTPQSPNQDLPYRFRHPT